MKVLYITNIPAPYRVEFWNELGKNCELTVWFEAVNEKDREWEVSGLGNNFKYEFLKGATFRIDKHINPSIIKKLNKERFDVYIMGGYSSPTEMLAIFWLKLNNIPFLLNSDGGFIRKNEKPILRAVKTYFISSAGAYLSSGTNCSEYLKYYGADANKIYRYPFASVSFHSNELANLSLHERAELKRQLGLRNKVMLSIGRFISLKGLDDLIEAFRQIDDDNTSLILIGGGPEKKKYENLIREFNLSRKVLLIDFLHKKELIKYWKIADLFVFPSKNDVWGLVLNEAITFGLPVVATTGAGGSYDLIIENENGYMIAAGDIEELAAKSKKILQDTSLQQRFGTHSKELAKQYTAKEMAKAHMKIFNEFLQYQKEDIYAR